MSPLLERIKKRLLSPIPPFIFFFIMFYLLNMTWGLMLKEEGIKEFSFFTILISALIVAKVFLIIDHLPFTNVFEGRPLIYQTLWKTSLYSSATLFVRTLDVMYPFVWSSKSFTTGFWFFITEVNWARFWAIQIWFSLLFFVFIAGREVVRTIGPTKIRKMFLGR